MTNAEIIFNNRVFLMEQGVIKGIPGTSLTIMDEQGEREIQMPEEIKTLPDWNKMGFRVKKGEHPIARFGIWMPKKGKSKADAETEGKGEAEEQETPKGFYKKVCNFFTADQVKANKD